MKLAESTASGGSVEIEFAARHPTDYYPFVAWSPDGKWLAITDRAAEDAALPKSRPCINLPSLETGERRRLTTVPPNQTGFQ
jgi:hypothetical protein